MIKSPRIAPSILAADFARLGEQIAAVEAVSDLLHIDVMDGHFVPNLSLGIPVIASLRRVSGLYFDCHMMTTNPDAYFDELRAAGADLVSVHIEAIPDPTRAAARARAAGLDFGLVLNPATPFAAVAPFLELCDLLLVMSVEPGFGGQAFLPEVLPKIEAARNMVDSEGLEADIQIDGGVTVATAPVARRAGADLFVAGSAVFGREDPAGAVKELRTAIEAATETT